MNFTKTLILVLLAALATATAARGQEESPTPTPSTTTATPNAESVEMQREIERYKLMKQLELAKKEYEKARYETIKESITGIKNSLPANSAGGNNAAGSGGNSSSELGALKADAETIALSYMALEELTGEVVKEIEKIEQIRNIKYSRFVIYNREDFASLARYHLFKRQVEAVFHDYKQLAKMVEEETRGDTEIADLNSHSSDVVNNRSTPRGGGLSTLLTLANVPSFITPVAESIGAMLNTFRTTVIESSTDTGKDNDALAAALGNRLQARLPAPKVYFPKAFVPEYDLETQNPDSVLAQLTRLRVFRSDLIEMINAYNKLSPEIKEKKPKLARLISEVKFVKSQMETISPDLNIRNAALSSSAENSDEALALESSVNELRALIRAEKINQMINGGETASQTGILQVRVIKSGGTKRESRNLFLGNKTRYSGSAVIEVLLFDKDGTLQMSKTFARHTGFRKL